MNKTLLFFGILIISCTNTSKEKTTDNNAGAKATIAGQLDGYYLSDSYLTDVDSSRSIYRSREYRTRLWGFRLEKENLLSGSPTINGFTEHEGGYGADLKFDSIKNVFTSYPEGSSSIPEPFELKFLDSTHVAFDFGDKKEVYRKVSGEQTELRRILFEGKFKDLTRDNKVIKFSKDGTIEGLGDKKYFELVFDFGEGIFYDAGTFYPNRDSADLLTNGQMFHFKISEDTLKLYLITLDLDEMDHTIGDMEYLLVKSEQ